MENFNVKGVIRLQYDFESIELAQVTRQYNFAEWALTNDFDGLEVLDPQPARGFWRHFASLLLDRVYDFRSRNLLSKS